LTEDEGLPGRHLRWPNPASLLGRWGRQNLWQYLSSISREVWWRWCETWGRNR